MHLPGSRIRIAQLSRQATPDGGRGDFRPDQWVWITAIYYPGEPYPPGSIGARTSKDGAHETWAFWTDYDIDGAFIFRAEDVAELEIPASYGALPAAFDKAPFPIRRYA